MVRSASLLVYETRAVSFHKKGQRTFSALLSRVFFFQALGRSGVGLDALGAFIDGNGCRHDHVDLLCQRLELFEHCLIRYGIVTADLECRVNEEIGNIVVGGQDAGDKAVQSFSVGDAIGVGVDQTGFICNIETKLIALFDADNGTVGLRSGFVNKVDKGLGLSGAFTTDE